MNTTEPRSRSAISIVVIGRNEGERLRRCLESVQVLAVRGLATEVIYVDSASTDRSLELAGQLGACFIGLKDGRLTAARARNAGWSRASADLVLFLDGDTVLHPGFVENALPLFDQLEVGVVWGHRRELFPTRSIYNRVLDLEWILPVGLSRFCGGDSLMRVEALRRSGGFDETLIAGEEPELSQRLRKSGYSIVHIDHPMTGHDIAMTRFSQYWLRAVRSGYAYAEVSSRFDHGGFWRVESQYNLRKTGLLACILLLAATLSVRGRSVWPLLGAGLIFFVAVVRTAWKSRKKSASWFTLLLYGIHSHFQHFAICQGQLQYFWSSRFGKASRLIEYKKV
jgi:cellulose synthase/poly-beta-1,6-N-acetylglucosamine synthase-like glycosyltransferase